MNEYVALKAARTRAGKTAADVATYMGVSEDMVRRYDSGRSEMTLRQAALYAEFLGYQLGDLLPHSQISAKELEPLLAALGRFAEDEKLAIIEKVTRDLAFIDSLAASRSLSRQAE